VRHRLDFARRPYLVVNQSEAVTAEPSTARHLADSRIVRGGSWSQGLIAVANYTRREYPTGYQLYNAQGQPEYLYYTDDDTGFRLAGLAEFSVTV